VDSRLCFYKDLQFLHTLRVICCYVLLQYCYLSCVVLLNKLLIDWLIDKAKFSIDWRQHVCLSFFLSFFLSLILCVLHGPSIAAISSGTWCRRPRDKCLVTWDTLIRRLSWTTSVSGMTDYSLQSVLQPSTAFIRLFSRSGSKTTELQQSAASVITVGRGSETVWSRGLEWLKSILF